MAVIYCDICQKLVDLDEDVEHEEEHELWPSNWRILGLSSEEPTKK